MPVLKHRSSLLFVLFSSFVMTSLAGAADQEKVSTPEVKERRVSDVDVSEPGALYSRLWGITREEYKRYLELKIVDSHFSDTNVSPYEVLGKYAQTPVEQKKYADMFNKKMVEQQVRSVEWWAAVSVSSQNMDLSYENYRTMAPGAAKQIDALLKQGSDHVKNKKRGAMMSTNQRAKLFVTPECGEPCSVLFNKALVAQNNGQYAGVDVIFIGMKNPDVAVVQKWGKDNNLTVDIVKNRVVTLNHDSKKFTVLRDDRPAPLLVNDNGSEITL